MEIRTKILAKAADKLSALLDEAGQGLVDVQQGRIVIGASNAAARIIKTDVEARTAQFKLRALEAKQVNQRPEEIPAP